MRPRGASDDWIEPLLERYRTAMGRRGDDLGELATPYETLRLAARVARTLGSESATTSPRSGIQQVAVLGPTQAGKSSLVNHLLDRTVAGVSALAGHTVHAQAFAPERAMDDQAIAALTATMAPLTRRERTDLERDDLGSWSLQFVSSGSRALLQQEIVWDTPDFDSIEAGRYREAVLAPASHADVIVLVLSKDKYGDLSVWERIDALALLGTPLVVALNKLDGASQATVAAAFVSRWTERIGAPVPETVLIPWVDNDSWPEETSTALLDALNKARHQARNTDARRAALQSFIEAHKSDWLAPVEAAVQTRLRWEQAVEDVQTQALSSYASRYLEDTERFDALQRTIAELLTLLELPGLARGLAKTRDVVTWPARTLFGIGRKRLGKQVTTVEDQELDILAGIFTEAILAIREFAREAESAGDPGGSWRAIDRRLAAEQNALAMRWREEATSLSEIFQPRIEASARELHDRLAEQPALLNTLRATRVTTDAAGVAIAVKSGGLAPADLIIAPVMLSITSLLTESVLGRYLDGISDRLKDELRELVRQRLIKPVLGDSLLQMEHDISETDLLGTTLDPALARVLSV